MQALVTLLTWYAYFAGATCAAVLFMGAVQSRRDRKDREWRARHTPRRATVAGLVDDRPRVIHIETASGVMTLRPDRELVIHGEGSEWR